uniref:Uncharacterized protein n=1 Tax=Arundo donax TaxID=35708 RepID=A0A0A9ANI0_ARUDO
MIGRMPRRCALLDDLQLSATGLEAILYCCAMRSSCF